MKKITVELDSPVMYAGGNGGEVEGSFIEISEPTGKVATYVAILKAEVGAATRKAFADIDSETVAGEKDEKAKAEEPNPDEDGATLFSVLTMGGADMARVMVTFKELLRETAQIGGEKTLTGPIYDRMSYPDIEKAFKKYLGHFIAG